MITCKICNSIDRDRYSGPQSERMAKYSLCFTCAFWDIQVEEDIQDPHHVVVSKGHHYIIGPENIHPTCRGFRGEKFQIQFNDGRLIETCNLWSQGEIPERWRPFLPDNAKFILR